MGLVGVDDRADRVVVPVAVRKTLRSAMMFSKSVSWCFSGAFVMCQTQNLEEVERVEHLDDGGLSVLDL